MYKRESLGLDEAKIAIDAMLKEASKDPRRPQAMAVVDAAGELICFARMDGGFRLNQEMAVRKASTAVQVGINTADFGMALPAVEMSFTDFGSTELTTIQGGICVINPDTNKVIGGIGVSGRMASEDEEIARSGLNAIKL